MKRYICGKPDYLVDEPCPLDTGELESCEDCPHVARDPETGGPATNE